MRIRSKAFALLLTLFVGNGAFAQKVERSFYIDFGQNNVEGQGFVTAKDAQNHIWNNLHGQGKGAPDKCLAQTSIELKSADGKDTRYKMTLSTDFSTNGFTNGGLQSPSRKYLLDLAVETATQDYFFLEGGQNNGEIVLSNLDPERAYRFHSFGSRVSSDDRSAFFAFNGENSWSGIMQMGGTAIGAEGYNGNNNKVLVSDPIFPDEEGKIVLTITKKNAGSMVYLNCMKVEELSKVKRPAAPLKLIALQLSGNAEDVSFTKVKKNIYQSYARLKQGTFNLQGKTAEGDVVMTCTGERNFDIAGAKGVKAFVVNADCVASIVVDAACKTIDITPLTLNIRGNMGAGNPELAYKGDGVWESKVTLKDTPSQQWVDKTLYFAFNNDDAMAIKRLRNAPSRYALGMASNGQDVENIYQNAGTYTFTVDMKNGTYKVAASVDENRISVFGSSVANGEGAIDKKGYRYLYGQHLIERFDKGLSQTRFYTSNVSIGGNTTNHLLNRYDDLMRDFGRYVIFGLSLGNEGIHGAKNPDEIFAQWRDNMLRLISMVRADGKIPVVMNNYTRSDYNDADYDYVKKLNLLIHEWDVPSFNCLGSIDKGNGQWADGYVADTYHQNTEGHYEFFCSMVPSLFDALKAGKAQPKRNVGQSLTLTADKSICFEPEGTAHPFTVSLRMKGGKGQVMQLACSTGKAVVKVEKDGRVTLLTPAGNVITSTVALKDKEWHHVSVTTYYAQKRTLLYVDDVCAGVVDERLGELNEVSIGGAKRELSELFFWRSAMTPEEIAAVTNLRMLKSSLEIYVPMNDEHNLCNMAQSTNSVKLASVKGRKE